MLFEKVSDIAYAIATETEKAVKIVRAMIVDAETATEAKATAKRHTQCPNCQAGLTNWLIANPAACEAEIETAHHDIWSECPACAEEYAEWSAECDRKPEPPVPVCPVLAALHRLTTIYPGGNGFFILDEIFVVLRMESTSFSRDALLETLRSYYRDEKVLFRPGFGSQLQFALPKKERPA